MKWHLHRGEAFAFLRELGDETIDALITDPPYSSGGFTRGDRSNPARQKYQQSNVADAHEAVGFTGDNRDQRGFLAWCTLWLTEAFRVLKPGAPVVLFTDWRQLPITTDALQAARPAMGRFSAASEFGVWGSKGPMPQREDVGCLIGHLAARPVVVQQRRHLTEKPLEVMRHVVKICAPGGIVLDPFTGSGTTGEASILEGRHFVGCELSEEYHAVANDRLAKAVA